MARIVQKFGGTSVADLERIHAVAEQVKTEVDAGHQIVVVVSAMAGVTNQLVGYVEKINTLYDAREYDTVVSSGEQITAGLLAMALQSLGVDARSWLGWQIPIRTDNNHGKARIEHIDGTLLDERLLRGEVVVVPGFQGIGRDGRIATLGRGGSDTSAVALAVALNADRCDIYTDVDGVYTTDPRIAPEARKITDISYEEMLELASLGTKVLQTRSVEIAMKGNVRVQVRSSFFDAPGTLVTREEEIVEQSTIRGVAFARDEAKITLVGVQDEPGVAASIFGPLAKGNINVDMIVQNISASDGTTDMTFSLTRSELERALKCLEECRENVRYRDIIYTDGMAKVSIVGVGMRSHVGVAAKMFETLSSEGINIQVITTSEIKVSVLIDDKYTELAVRALHKAYGLEGTDTADTTDS